MKSYTDIEQSKKLAEFLPTESADMHYVRRICDFMGNSVDDKWSVPKYGNPNSEYANYIVQNFTSYEKMPCWSLAALHCVASTYCSRLEITLRADKKYNVFAVKDDFVFRSFDDHPDGFDNLVDACYEMILKLKEQNLL